MKDSLLHPSTLVQMTIIVDANGFGDGKGSHVTVAVIVEKGEYDDELN